MQAETRGHDNPARHNSLIVETYVEVYTMINEFNGQYRWLSNFWLCPVVYDGLVYPSTENAYQAAKLVGLNRMNFTVCSPGKAKRLGRELGNHTDWDIEKLEVMNAVLLQKFCPESFLAEKLIVTSPMEIVEGNAWNDTFWGVCKGEGENNLGKLIMAIRHNLIYTPNPNGATAPNHTP